MQSTLIAPRSREPIAERIELPPSTTSGAVAPRIHSSVSSWRYELKYTVPQHARGPLLADLSPYVEPDGHGDRAGRYVVHSVYFDSPDLSCFRAKLDGLPNRFKLRVRSYVTGGSATTGVVKLEIKERDAERVRKLATTLDARSYETLAPSLESFQLPHPSSLASSSALTQFFRLKTLHAMRKVVSVTYDRRALVPRFDRRCRITIDTDLTGGVEAGATGFSVDRPSRSLSDDAVLEIKTPAEVPTWLARLIRKHRLQRCPYSKYALAVTRCLAVEA